VSQDSSNTRIKDPIFQTRLGIEWQKKFRFAQLTYGTEVIGSYSDYQRWKNGSRYNPDTPSELIWETTLERDKIRSIGLGGILGLQIPINRMFSIYAESTLAAHYQRKSYTAYIYPLNQLPNDPKPSANGEVDSWFISPALLSTIGISFTF
jgi:hypothetical protein